MRPETKWNRCDWAVVLACIGFALVSLGAVSETGRKRSKESICRANLRQWHDIFQGYIDPNGRFISGDPWTPGYYWVKYLSEEHKDWKRTRIWFCPEAQKPVMDESGRMMARNSVFSAWGIYKGLAGLGPNGVSGSYGLNSYVIPITSTYEGGVRPQDGWRNLLEVPHGSTVPMFFDALRFDLWPLCTDGPAEYEFAPWTSNQMARCCINRHVGAVNCLLVDGSVRKVGLKELWMLKWHQSFNTAGPWTKAGGVVPSDWPEWIRPFKDY
ncbi:MAG: hypothetical protein EHM35_07020 [Planctomycetaceae bacterium]|nr:MAG: hypothetical protein EHM35_07020 [Planctomycetaceae bacterium]